VASGLVICAFDDSPSARRAAEVAGWLAAALNARLELIHVFDPGAQPALPREGDLRDPAIHLHVRAGPNERTKARMQAIMEGVAGRLPAGRGGVPGAGGPRGPHPARGGGRGEARCC
jgi:hypothetical protein